MLTWQVGDVRITQIVELTTASLGPYLLPQATPGRARGDRLDRAVRRRAPTDRAEHSRARARNARRVHRRRHLHRQRQGAHVSEVEFHERQISRRFRRRWFCARSCRHRLVHAYARRSRRLEYAPRRRALAADVSERALPVRRKRMAALERGAAGVRTGVCRLGAADFRLRLSDVGWRISPRHRRDRARTDARTYAGARQRAHHVAGRGSRDHRRHDPSPVSDRAPALVEHRRRRSQRRAP